MKAVLLLLGLSVPLAGCGQKGPLYLPDKHPAAVTAPAPASTAPAAAPGSPATPRKPGDPDPDATTPPPAPK